MGARYSPHTCQRQSTEGDQYIGRRGVEWRGGGGCTKCGRDWRRQRSFKKVQLAVSGLLTYRLTIGSVSF